MASTSSNLPTPRFPPKRGQVKAQIFESFSEIVPFPISKAGEVLAKIKGGGGGSDSSTSFTASPPLSAYASDAYSNYVSFAISKAGEVLAKIKGGGGGSDSSTSCDSSTSFTASPPLSAYASDAYSD
ncbi:Hypothetical predicted protein [Olea europaea subsp. europaea]|uniref:Uncharacterized protein n=1 Tax=Olea europaea subsp. europaea TaxID=158383 RepID=A0A8S0PCA0_OLEEU|nr:Hypothetical predicted protein [Olea europaea subsp. europaea]